MPKKNFSFGDLWSFDIFSAMPVSANDHEGRGGECGSCLGRSAPHLHINAHGTPLTLHPYSILTVIAPQGRTHDSEVGSYTQSQFSVGRIHNYDNTRQ